MQLKCKPKFETPVFFLHVINILLCYKQKKTKTPPLKIQTTTTTTTKL